MFRARFLDQGLPRCLVHWIWQFLRDRRACVKHNGTRSGERAYRAGLPQGSVLASTLFLLWSAPFVASLTTVPGVSPFMYADDTAALCGGNDISTTKRRSQQATDALVRWTRQSKMLIAGEKTQLLVLSQNAADAKNSIVIVIVIVRFIKSSIKHGFSALSSIQVVKRRTHKLSKICPKIALINVHTSHRRFMHPAFQTDTALYGKVRFPRSVLTLGSSN